MRTFSVTDETPKSPQPIQRFTQKQHNHAQTRVHTADEPMASEKQIAANRANAAKSTGPRTPEGKAVSSLNATRHHLLARSFVLQSECPERFEEFVESFYAEYNPSTPTETALVDTMATARWRLIRMSNLEAAIIDYEYSLDKETANLKTPARATLAYRRASDCGRSVELMNRAETRLQNQFNSAFDRLRRISRTNPISPAR
jgi:hypothetical protein